MLNMPVLCLLFLGAGRRALRIIAVWALVTVLSCHITLAHAAPPSTGLPPYISLPPSIGTAAAAKAYLEKEYAARGYFRNASSVQGNAVQPNNVGPCNMCRDGQRWRPVIKSYQIDGCSVPSGVTTTAFRTRFRTTFENCCNAHDRCYQTCNSRKGSCDSTWYNCMWNRCNSFSGSRRQQCRSDAGWGNTAVDWLGGFAFCGRQREYCECYGTPCRKPWYCPWSWCSCV
ncbi:hypothetical protein DFJ74DRAFT_659569 [Hyaloraphidium curvatum]|nr:hypothetical protein DFJ74DRAFT_659569 [Hyaloraphidium curvatum]